MLELFYVKDLQRQKEKGPEDWFLFENFKLTKEKERKKKGKVMNSVTDSPAIKLLRRESSQLENNTLIV